MTKGKAASWKCVGSELSISEIGNYRGFTNGKSKAITVYEEREKQNILTKTEKIAKDLDSLCHDLKNFVYSQRSTVSRTKRHTSSNSALEEIQ